MTGIFFGTTCAEVLLPLRGRIDFQVFAAVPNNNFVLIRGETEVDALRLAGKGF